MGMGGCTWDARMLRALAVPALVIVPGLRAEEPQEEYLGEAPERYAQVRFVQGPVLLRKGEAEESLVPGVPVAEGDVVESRGRGVLQLADGTRIAFGEDTRLEISALFAEREGNRVVLLRLERGRIRVQLGGQEGTLLKVDSPAGSLRLQDRGNSALQIQGGGETLVRVYGGRALYANAEGKVRLAAGDQLTVLGPEDGLDRIRGFNTYEEDAFDRWAQDQLRIGESESRARVPVEIRHYADSLDGHGDWVYVDDLERWCWRPQAVRPDWRPYWVGHWGCHPGGLTWVSDEPWGFVTYHFGRWGWQARWGWYWIPGVYYSPAWVGWQGSDLYCGWAPLGLWNQPVAWGYGPWGGGACWNVVIVTQINQAHLHRVVLGDPRVLPPAWAHRWHQGPMIIRHPEWRDPQLFRRVAWDDAVRRQRMDDYARRAREGTGRGIAWRPPARGGSGPRPFEGPEDRAGNLRLGPRDGRPAAGVREVPGTPTPMPEIRVERPRPGGNPQPTPRPEPRRQETLPVRPEPVPIREAPGVDRPRPREERRVEPTPAPREYRPTPEPRPQPRPEPSRPREERRVEPAPQPRPTPAPAPHPAPAPKPEKHEKPERETKHER